jgi:ribosome silencing factor RsfS/YbeB/iojap
MSSRKNVRPPARAALIRAVMTALEDMKALDIKSFDVRAATDAYDAVIIASGNSDRHTRSIADRVAQNCKAAGFRPLGVEGGRDGEWVLVDLNDVIVHVMLPRVREFYALEQLWDAPAPALRKPARKAAKKAAKRPAKKAAGKTVAKAAARKGSGAKAAPARKPAKKAAKRTSAASPRRAPAR